MNMNMNMARSYFNHLPHNKWMKSSYLECENAYVDNLRRFQKIWSEKNKSLKLERFGELSLTKYTWLTRSYLTWISLAICFCDFLPDAISSLSVRIMCTSGVDFAEVKTRILSAYGTLCRLCRSLATTVLVSIVPCQVTERIRLTCLRVCEEKTSEADLLSCFVDIFASEKIIRSCGVCINQRNWINDRKFSLFIIFGAMWSFLIWT